MSQDHFPDLIRQLPQFDGPFDAYRLAAVMFCLRRIRQAQRLSHTITQPEIAASSLAES